MNIDDIYKLVQFLSNKYQNGYVTPDDFNRSFNMASKMYMNHLMGDTETFAPARAVPRVGVGMGQSVSGKLAPFTYIGTALVAPTTTTATYPADLARILSIQTSDGTAVRRGDSMNFPAMKKSVIDSASPNKWYLYLDTFSTIKFNADISLQGLTIDYVKYPIDAKWAYTGNLVYSVDTSTQTDWDDNSVNDIIFRQLGLIGMHLKDSELSQYSQLIKNQGE